MDQLGRKYVQRYNINMSLVLIDNIWGFNILELI